MSRACKPGRVLLILWAGLLASRAGVAAPAPAPPATNSVQPPVVILQDRETRAYSEAIAAIRSRRRAVQVFVVDDPRARAVLRDGARSHLFVALGPRSATRLARSSAAHRAAAFVQRRQTPRGMAAVLLQVPHAQQAAWIRQAFPGRHQIIVLHRPGGPIDVESLRRASDAAHLDLRLAEVQRSGDAVPAFAQTLSEHRRGALLWLLPDPTAINSDSVVPLVQTALAARVPVLGFSEYFLRVGALAAVVLDYEQCGLQALELAASGSDEVQAPRHARLRVDGRLAERLGIAVRESADVEVQR